MQENKIIKKDLKKMKNNMLETQEINFLCELSEFFCALCGLIFLLSLVI